MPTRAAKTLSFQTDNRYGPLTETRLSDPISLRYASHVNVPSIELDALLIGKNRTAAVKTLIDSGATGNLIHHKVIKAHRIKTNKLDEPLSIKNADDSIGYTSEYVKLTLEIKDNNGQTH